MTAARLAEQATLGALLIDSTTSCEVSGWLRAEDFADPWHGEVYTVIRELTAAHIDAEPARVGAALIDRHGHRVADAPRLLDLLQAVPTRPQLARYAAMVLEGSLRRQVACHGVLLEAAALASAIERTPHVVETVTSQVDAAVDAAATQWANATGLEGTSTRVIARGGTELGALSGVGADRLLARHPLPGREQVAEREVDLLACLITHPDHLPEVSGWLRPDALVDDTWRPVYTALLNLSEAHQRVDVVTVAWEVTRTSRAHGLGPLPTVLRAAVDASSIRDPAHAIGAVAADQLRATATRAADALRADAAHPGLDLGDLFGTTRLLTDTVRVAATRLDAHHGQASTIVDQDPMALSLARLMVVSR